MTIGSAFPYSGLEQVPAGKCKVILQASAEDIIYSSVYPKLSWTVASAGRKYTPHADGNGRAELIVDAGFNYKVSIINPEGYDGESPQYFYAESSGVVICPFYIERERAILKDTVTESDDQYIRGIKTFQSGARVPDNSTGDYAINARTADKRYIHAQNAVGIVLLFKGTCTYMDHTFDFGTVVSPKSSVSGRIRANIKSTRGKDSLNIPVSLYIQGDREDGIIPIQKEGYFMEYSTFPGEAGEEMPLHIYVRIPNEYTIDSSVESEFQGLNIRA